MGIYFAARLLELRGTAEKGELCPCLTHALSRELADAREHAAEIHQQLEQVPTYAGKLHWLEQEIKQGSHFQRHRLGDKWSQEEQTGLDSILETLDINATHNFWTKGRTCVPAVKDGIAYATGENIYLLPNFARGVGNVGNAAMLTALVGGTGAAIVGATTIGLVFGVVDYAGKFGITIPDTCNAPLGMLVNGGMLLGSLALVGGGSAALTSLLTITKNPFSSLAGEMERRVAYVREHSPNGAYAQ